MTWREAIRAAQKDFDPLTDHCSMSPDKIDGIYIGECCFRHDTAYAATQNRKDFPKVRKEIDAYFKEDLYATLREGGATRFRAWLVSTVYYRAVRRFNPAFRLLQWLLRKNREET